MTTTYAKSTANQQIKDEAFLAFKNLGIKPRDAINQFLEYVATHGDLPFSVESMDQTSTDIDSARETISSTIKKKREDVDAIADVIKKAEDPGVILEQGDSVIHVDMEDIAQANKLLGSAEEDLNHLSHLTQRIQGKLDSIEEKTKMEMTLIEDVVEHRLREFKKAKKWVDDILQLTMSDPRQQKDAHFWTQFDQCERLIKEADEKLQHASEQGRKVWAQEVSELLDLLKNTKETFDRMKRN